VGEAVAFDSHKVVVTAGHTGLTVAESGHSNAEHMPATQVVYTQSRELQLWAKYFNFNTLMH